ncbi:hypothetical protein L873DRAFT_1804151 [Choiromyces venosus 120613-1]|uniref:Uncharacterized protein n=1 Tax=Choiromyces venosus 120613-1 TaxID=1336337 RepID=A0A3N4JWN5_9PEZI|nr:hypothetical protein L873DRAFT_1804151 [Choiromyces venosus 120613-1]
MTTNNHHKQQFLYHYYYGNQQQYPPTASPVAHQPFTPSFIIVRAPPVVQAAKPTQATKPKDAENGKHPDISWMFSPDSGYYKAPVTSTPSSSTLVQAPTTAGPIFARQLVPSQGPDWAVVQVSVQPVAKKPAMPNAAGFYL